MNCDKCKKTFAVGNRHDGLPNGVSMFTDNGKMITLCADCVINLGTLDDEQKDAFFRELTDKPEGGMLDG